MKKRETNKISAGPERDRLSWNKGVLTILHVDDDSNDTALIQAASEKARINFDIQNVHDGDEAIAYLSGDGKYADRKRYRLPALVLLDLKMPRFTGMEILKWIRSNPALRDLPIVVLSGSEHQSDIRNAYAQGANSYLVKPLRFSSLVELMESIGTVWLAANCNAPVARA